MKSEVYVGFSPFFLTFNVEVLSGVVGAASFPSVEQTIAKVSQQRRQKREGGKKNRTKTGEKGLVAKSELSPSSCTFGVKVLLGGVCAALLSSVEQTITKLGQQRWQKPRKKGERSDKQSRNSGKGRTNHKVVEHRGQK